MGLLGRWLRAESLDISVNKKDRGGHYKEPQRPLIDNLDGLDELESEVNAIDILVTTHVNSREDFVANDETIKDIQRRIDETQSIINRYDQALKILVVSKMTHEGEMREVYEQEHPIDMTVIGKDAKRLNEKIESLISGAGPRLSDRLFNRVVEISSKIGKYAHRSTPTGSSTTSTTGFPGQFVRPPQFINRPSVAKSIKG